MWFTECVLYLVRHGRTNANKEGRLQGRLDPDLDEIGHRQASAIADLVGVTLTPVMASVPHARSVRKQTAPNIEPEVRALCDDMLARLEMIWERSPTAKADA